MIKELPISELAPGSDSIATAEIWCNHIGDYIKSGPDGERSNDSAIDWWCFNTHKPKNGSGGKSGASWTQVHEFWVRSPEKFMMWLALYRQGVRHG